VPKKVEQINYNFFIDTNKIKIGMSVEHVNGPTPISNFRSHGPGRQADEWMASPFPPFVVYGAFACTAYGEIRGHDDRSSLVFVCSHLVDY